MSESISGGSRISQILAAHEPRGGTGRQTVNSIMKMENIKTMESGPGVGRSLYPHYVLIDTWFS